MKNRSATSKAYNPEVDFWKFIFAVIVFLHHLHHVIPDSGPFTRGYLAVEFFFIVSGYFTAAKVRSADAKGIPAPTTDRFLLGRIKNLIKPFLAAFAISFAACEIFSGNSVLSVLKDLLMSGYETGFMRLSGIQAGTFFNPPTWYISALLLAMAVLWPFAVRFGRPFFKVACPLVTLFCWALLFAKTGALGAWKEPVLSDFVLSGLVRAFAGLALGMFINECCAVADESGVRPTGAGRAFFLIIGLACLAFAVFYMDRAVKLDWSGKYDFCVALYLAAFLFIVFSGFTGIRDRLSRFDLSVLSKASLYIYLCHWVGVRFLEYRFGGVSPSFKQVIIPYTVVTLCAVVICRILVLLSDLFCGRLWPRIKKILFLSETEEKAE